MSDTDEPVRKAGFLHRIRNYFLTGLVVASPIGITVYIGWWFISLVDNHIKPLIPAAYNPETYLKPISDRPLARFLAA